MENETFTVHARFPLGQVVATRGAFEALGGDGDPRLAIMLLARHAAGDWGDLDEEDREANEEALRCDLRLLSSYRLVGGETVWIITERDRSVTTILTPDEY